MQISTHEVTPEQWFDLCMAFTPEPLVGKHTNTKTIKFELGDVKVTVFMPAAIGSGSINEGEQA